MSQCKNILAEADSVAAASLALTPETLHTHTGKRRGGEGCTQREEGHWGSGMKRPFIARVPPFFLSPFLLSLLGAGNTETRERMGGRDSEKNGGKGGRSEERGRAGERNPV